jgi:hypothetical protein
MHNVARNKRLFIVQGAHLELGKTNCFLQGVMFNYMGQTIRQQFCTPLQPPDI